MFSRNVPALACALLLSAPASAQDAVMLYRLHCSGCHGLEGAGSKRGRIPPFPNIVGQFPKEPEGRAYLVLVPGVANSGLPDAETAAVLNYVVRAWGESADFTDYTADEVRDIRQRRVDDIGAMRRALREKLARRGLSVDY